MHISSISAESGAAADPEAKCFRHCASGRDITPTVTGTGTGSRPVDVTMASVTLTLEATGRTGGKASEVQEDLTARVKKLLDHLGNQNVEKLYTGGVWLSRQGGRRYRSYGEGENTYKGSSRVTFEVSLARVGQFQDSVVATGETGSSNIRPFAAQGDVDAATKELTVQAVTEARKKAQLLAVAIGVQLGREVSVQVTNKMTNRSGDGHGYDYDFDSPYPFAKRGETVFVDVRIHFEQTPLAT